MISVNRSFRACWDASAGRRRIDPGSWGVHQPQEDDRITAGQLLAWRESKTGESGAGSGVAQGYDAAFSLHNNDSCWSSLLFKDAVSCPWKLLGPCPYSAWPDRPGLSTSFPLITTQDTPYRGQFLSLPLRATVPDSSEPIGNSWAKRRIQFSSRPCLMSDGKERLRPSQNRPGKGVTGSADH